MMLSYSLPAQNFLNHLCRQIEQLQRCEIIKENEVKTLCAKAREILAEESNVQKIASPVTVGTSPALYIDYLNDPAASH